MDNLYDDTSVGDGDTVDDSEKKCHHISDDGDGLDLGTRGDIAGACAELWALQRTTKVSKEIQLGKKLRGDAEAPAS